MTIKEDFKPIIEDSSESERDSVERKKSSEEETKDGEFLKLHVPEDEMALSPNVREIEIHAKKSLPLPVNKRQRRNSHQFDDLEFKHNG
jgi:hypothetical protein